LLCSYVGAIANTALHNMSSLIEVSEQWEVTETESSQSFQSLAVMEFSSSCGAETIQWILAKITSPTDKGGCGLLTSTILDENQKVEVIPLYINRLISK